MNTVCYKWIWQGLCASYNILPQVHSFPSYFCILKYKVLKFPESELRKQSWTHNHKTCGPQDPSPAEHRKYPDGKNTGPVSSHATSLQTIAVTDYSQVWFTHKKKIYLSSLSRVGKHYVPRDVGYIKEGCAFSAINLVGSVENKPSKGFHGVLCIYFSQQSNRQYRIPGKW